MVINTIHSLHSSFAALTGVADLVTVAEGKGTTGVPLDAVGVLPLVTGGVCEVLAPVADGALTVAVSSLENIPGDMSLEGVRRKVSDGTGC